MGSLIILALIFGAAILAPHLTPYKYDALDLDHTAIGPTLTAHHYFGTDQLGRDYFTRVLYGIGTTAKVAFLVAALSTMIGTLIGALAGYYGGWVDNLLMRFTDLILTLPALVVLLTLSALIGEGSPTKIAFLLALLFWTYLARIVRGTFLSLKEREYVEAARALGASDRRIMFRHLLPNALGLDARPSPPGDVPRDHDRAHLYVREFRGRRAPRCAGSGATEGRWLIPFSPSRNWRSTSTRRTASCTP
jgi:peptide/nickel transport system permease protein